MNRYPNYNATFYILDHVGSVISQDQARLLLAEGKLYTTRCQMIGREAEQAMGPAPDGKAYTYGLATYSGIITADCLDDAKEIAIERGWGEFVDGRIIDIIPQEEKPLLNITDQLN